MPDRHTFDAGLVTGPFKDTLNPLKEMTPEETALWTEIMDESFNRFKEVIDEGRGNLTLEQIAPLATGRIFTANPYCASEKRMLS